MVPGGWTLDGKKAVVPDGAVADFILVPAEDATGAANSVYRRHRVHRV